MDVLLAEKFAQVLTVRMRADPVYAATLPISHEIRDWSLIIFRVWYHPTRLLIGQQIYICDKLPGWSS